MSCGSMGCGGSPPSLGALSSIFNRSKSFEKAPSVGFVVVNTAPFVLYRFPIDSLFFYFNDCKIIDMWKAKSTKRLVEIAA